MKQLLWFFAVLFVFSTSANPVAGQESDPVVDQVVSLDEYLDRVKAVHTFFKARQMQPAIEQKQSDRFLGYQDWRLGADGRLNHLEPLIIQTSRWRLR